MKRMFKVHPWNDRRKAWIVRTLQGTSCGTIKSSKAAAQKFADECQRDYEREHMVGKRRKVKTRGVRHNMSWMELGTRITKIALLHPILRTKAEAALKRGLKWQAYRLVEVNKYGGRQQYGQWLWIPATGLIGNLDIAPKGSGGFFGAGRSIVHHAVSWGRAHPLARGIKEVWHAFNWGHSRRGKMSRYGGQDIVNSPNYEHWLEAREVAEREGRTIKSWDAWRSDMSSEFHEPWLRRHLDTEKRMEGLRRSSHKNPRARRVAKRLSSTTVLLLKGLRRRLWGIKNLAISTVVIGWDQVIDRTEQAILRSGVKSMFGGELREISGLWRRYKGCKMPLTTAISPASGALWKIDKALGYKR